MKLREITTIARGEYNPKEREFRIWPELTDYYKHHMKPLPGDSGLTYVTSSSNNFNRGVIILDPQNLGYYVGSLTLERARTIPEYTWQATLISVHPKYRGQGIAKSLYGLALLPKPEGLGLTLISDSLQTPGGVRNWLSLSQIPGVEVTGIVGVRKIDDNTLSKSPEIEDRYFKAMDELFGDVGGAYIDENVDFYFFEIPVKVEGSKLENEIKKSLIKIYPKAKTIDGRFLHTLLMAKYGGGV